MVVTRINRIRNQTKGKIRLGDEVRRDFVVSWTEAEKRKRLYWTEDVKIELPGRRRRGRP